MPVQPEIEDKFALNVPSDRGEINLEMCYSGLEECLPAKFTTDTEIVNKETRDEFDVLIDGDDKLPTLLNFTKFLVEKVCADP